MPLVTGQAIINDALTYLGILEQGGTPSASDSAYGLTTLNAFWNAWGVDEGMIYARVAQRWPLAAGKGIYTIGQQTTGGAAPDFSAPLPGKIYQAHAVTATGGAATTTTLGDGGSGYAANDTGIVPNSSGTQATYTVNSVSAAGAVLAYTVSAAGTGFLVGNGYPTQVWGGAQPGVGVGFTVNITVVSATGQNRTELDVVEATQYRSHNDLSASAQVPDELYPEFAVDQDGLMRLYLWPIQNAVSTLELDVSIPFTTWTLSSAYNLPNAMQDPIEWALAWRMMPGFGATVDQAVSQMVAANGEKSEMRLREMNKFNRKLPPGTEAAPAPQAAPQAGRAQ